MSSRTHSRSNSYRSNEGSDVHSVPDPGTASGILSTSTTQLTSTSTPQQLIAASPLKPGSCNSSMREVGNKSPNDSSGRASGGGQTPTVVCSASSANASPSAAEVVHGQAKEYGTAVKDMFKIVFAKVTDDEATIALTKSTSQKLELQKDKHVEKIIAVSRGEYDWGTQEECNDWLVNELKAHVHKRSWIACLRALLLIQRLLWEGSDVFRQRLGQKADEVIGVEHLKDFKHDGQGSTIQRPIIVFYALYNQELLRCFDILSPSLMTSIAATPTREVLPTVCKSDVRVAQNYAMAANFVLGQLVAGDDLPLHAINNQLTTEVYRRLIVDGKLLFAVLTKLLDVALDTYRRSPEEINREFVATFSVYHLVTNRLITFFGRLKNLGVHFGETIPEFTPLPEDVVNEVSTIQAHAPKQSLADFIAEGAARNKANEETPFTQEDNNSFVDSSSVANDTPKAEAHRPPPLVAAKVNSPSSSNNNNIGRRGSSVTVSPNDKPTSGDLTLTGADRIGVVNENALKSLHSPGMGPSGSAISNPPSGRTSPALCRSRRGSSGPLTDSRTEGVSSATAAANVADDIADRFTIDYTEMLGRGSFGKVYKAWDNELGLFVAVKEVELRVDSRGNDEGTGSGDRLSDLKGEFDTLRRLEHPNIVVVLALLIERSQKVAKIVMEWMPSGSLQAVLRATKRPMKEHIVARYARDLLNGLSYLHSQNILHRDIKPGNMLLSGGNVKWTDFGTCKVLSAMRDAHDTENVVGTVAYLAPECFRGHYSKGSDIWGLGCSLLEMLTAEVPWSDSGCEDRMSMLFHIGNAKPPDHHPTIPPVRPSEASSLAASKTTIDDDDSPLVMTAEGTSFEAGPVCISAAAHSFLERCFDFDPEDRPSADELLVHPFVTGEELK